MIGKRRGPIRFERAVVTADRRSRRPGDDWDDDLDDDDLGDDEPVPPRRISVLRLFLALGLVVGGLAAAGFSVKRAVVHVAPTATSATWFAPYVDATLSPYYQFQDPSLNPSQQVVLGFVVSSRTAACTPSWGGYFSEEAASETLSLDRRLAELRSEGGTAVVSFGGQSNGELALGCRSVSRLQAAYTLIIDRYGLTTVDFDIEGAAVKDAASIERRARALAAIQRLDRASGRELSVWLTLPVGADGLQPDGLNVVTQMRRAGVDLAGVNVLTMDFGVPETDMLAVVEHALTQTHRQLATVLRNGGRPLGSAAVWNRIGATVMIGQNDSNGEDFTIGDARALLNFTTTWRLGRVSLWSLNRDRQCGAATFNYVGVHSNTCGGVIESGHEFTNILSALRGSLVPAARETTAAPVPAPNPSNSPYPVWLPWPTYPDGYYVERDGYIYQAKWYSEGADPAAVSASTYLDPWQLIGPVMASDRAPTTTTLPTGTYPKWSPSTAYATGARILYDGLPYQARWYTMASSPAAASLDASASPWHPLFSFSGEPTPTP